MRASGRGQTGRKACPRKTILRSALDSKQKKMRHHVAPHLKERMNLRVALSPRLPLLTRNGSSGRSQGRRLQGRCSTHGADARIGRKLSATQKAFPFFRQAAQLSQFAASAASAKHTRHNAPPFPIRPNRYARFARLRGMSTAITAAIAMAIPTIRKESPTTPVWSMMIPANQGPR